MSEYYCYKCGAVTKKKKKDGTKSCAVYAGRRMKLHVQTMKQNQEKIEELILETSAGFFQQERELKNSTKVSMCDQKLYFLFYTQ